MNKSIIAWLFLASLCLAQDPPKPDETVVTDPPKVETKVVIQVPKGVLGEGKQKAPYVFDSSTKNYLTLPLLDKESLKSLQWITDDGPPDIEPIGPNTADNPSLILGFSQASPGLYLVEADWDKGFAKVWLLIKGSGPAPPVVDPIIPPGPGPTPPVDPSVTTGFRALFVYESADKLTKDQSNIMTSVRIRKYLDKVCTKGTEGQYKGLAEYRFWDDDGKDVAKDTANIMNMWKRLKPNLPGGTSPTAMPFLAVEANGKPIIFPLRDGVTVETVMTKLVELGGPE